MAVVFSYDCLMNCGPGSGKIRCALLVTAALSFGITVAAFGMTVREFETLDSEEQEACLLKLVRKIGPELERQRPQLGPEYPAPLPL